MRRWLVVLGLVGALVVPGTASAQWWGGSTSCSVPYDYGWSGYYGSNCQSTAGYSGWGYGTVNTAGYAVGSGWGYPTYQTSTSYTPYYGAGYAAPSSTERYIQQVLQNDDRAWAPRPCSSVYVRLGYC